MSDLGGGERCDGALAVGRLIYLVGPSGAGKDTLIDAARQQLLAHGVYVARRIITRAQGSIGEDADSVTCSEFESLRSGGAFAMSWQANGLSYGVSNQIDQWLAAGRNVLVNGSREYLPQVRQRYPGARVIALTVSESVLRERLLARGRETLEQVEARLLRGRSLQVAGEDVVSLDNSGALADTVNKLLAACI